MVARATPSAACASSRSPRASMRGSLLRTRSRPKREVSPRSPVRVVTRARRAIDGHHMGRLSLLLRGGGEIHASRWRQSEGQEAEEEVQRAARARDEEALDARPRGTHDVRGHQTEAQRARLLGPLPTLAGASSCKVTPSPAATYARNEEVTVWR